MAANGSGFESEVDNLLNNILWTDDVWSGFRTIANERQKDGYVPALIHETDKVITEKQQKRNKAYAERKQQGMESLKKQLEQKEQLAQWRNDKRKFYFASLEHDFSDIGPDTAARLFYIGIYLTYSGELQKHKKAIKKDDLCDILGLSGTSVWRFMNEVKGKYLFEDNRGRLTIPDRIFYRGKIQTGTEYQQVYFDSVKTLYESLPPKRKRYLGYACQLLQYVNIEYNILCHNIYETELDNIKPLTVDELCGEIGYGREDRDKLVRLYNNNLTFEINGRQERLVSFVTNGLDLRAARIFINPHVIYHGHIPSEVESLGKFCEI